MKATAFVSLLLLTGAILPSSVNAADPTEALIRKGVDKRRRNDDKGALPLFRRAYESSRSPRAAAQLGLCEQALELWMEAEAHLSEALISQTDVWVNGQRGTLDAALGQTRKHLTRIDIAEAPAGATVNINGAFRGNVEDAPFFVEPKAAEVAIQSGDEVSLTNVSNLSAGQALTIKFAPKKRAVPPLPSAQTLDTPGKDQVAVVAQEDNPISPSGPDRGLRIAKWVAFGSGGVALALGTYALVERNGAANDFNGVKTDNGDRACFLSAGKVVGPMGEVASAKCSDLDARVSSMSTASIVGFVAGAALVSAGLTLWFLEPRSNNDNQTFACAPNIFTMGRAHV
jgi:hypothetical protein